MSGMIRMIMAVAVSYFAIYGISSIIGYEVWWLSLLICTVCSCLVMYVGRTYHMEERNIRGEYILDLRNNKIGELFVPSRYPDYKKERSGSDGNDYISASGAVICTKFVDKKQRIRVKDSGAWRHLNCVFIIIFAYLLRSWLLSAGQSEELLEEHLQVPISNLCALKDGGVMQIISALDARLKPMTEHLVMMLSKILSKLPNTDWVPTEQADQFMQGWKELVSRIVHNIVNLFLNIKVRLQGGL